MQWNGSGTNTSTEIIMTSLELYVSRVRICVTILWIFAAHSKIEDMEFPPEYKMWEFYEAGLSHSECAIRWVKFRYNC